MILRPSNGFIDPQVEATEIIKKSIKLGVHRDPRQALYLKYLEINPNDSKISDLAKEVIDNENRSLLFNYDPFRATNPILPNVLVGNIGIGLIPPKNIPWLLHPRLLTNHICVAGRSHGGKTNLILLILAQILENNIGTIKIFDRKLDYACLTVYPNFHYWSFKDHYTNWLEPPPGLKYKQWLSILFEIFANYLDIRIAGRNLLMNTALWLGEQRNSESTEVYPTLKDVRNVIRSKKHPFQSHLARYQETILNRITGLIDLYGDQVCSSRKLNWDKYVNSSWALSLDGLPTDMQNLIIAVTTGKLLSHKMATNQRIIG